MRTVYLVMAILLGSCVGEASVTDQRLGGCADVIAVDVIPQGDHYRFDVTIRSDDTGWDKYADAWQVRAPDGTVLGERILAHPHETEQPFTRALSGVEIPPGVTAVMVAARDSVLGFCGATLAVSLPA